jgi:hypothetical protein
MPPTVRPSERVRILLTTPRSRRSDSNAHVELVLFEPLRLLALAGFLPLARLFAFLG